LRTANGRTGEHAKASKRRTSGERFHAAIYVAYANGATSSVMVENRMHRLLRPLSFLALLLVAACAGPPPPALAQDQKLEIKAIILPLSLEDAKIQRVGKLIWRGGLSLTANSLHFGGWSDLYVAPDSKSLVSISDVGGWMTAAIDLDADGNLRGLNGGRIGKLHDLEGKPLANKRDADSESMAHLPDGSWLVGFERRHRIWRYPAGDEAAGAGLAGTPVAVEGPAELPKQPENGGLEAMNAGPDGRLVMLSEEYSVQSGTSMGWIGTPAGKGWRWASFNYTTIPDFVPTSIALLPDGSYAVIERAFDVVRGVRCRIMRFDAAQLQPGGTVHAEELARLASPYTVDNLEGLAATKGPRGETLLWLVSDDNFNPLQRTLLLLFELAP